MTNEVTTTITTGRARQLATEVSHLVELCATFQATYGRGYQLKPGSPQHAWDLFEQMIYRQRVIAGMMEPDALDEPILKWGNWWEEQDSIDIGVLYELSKESTHLITACAYNAARQPARDWSPAVHYAQRVIAGILHIRARVDPVPFDPNPAVAGDNVPA